MSMKTRFTASIAVISGVFTILNSWSLFQRPAFFFAAACHLLAFGSLTLLSAIFLLFDEKRKTYWGTLITASSTLAFLSFGLSGDMNLLMPALIAFYLGTLGGMLSLIDST